MYLAKIATLIYFVLPLSLVLADLVWSKKPYKLHLKIWGTISAVSLGLLIVVGFETWAYPLSLSLPFLGNGSLAFQFILGSRKVAFLIELELALILLTALRFRVASDKMNLNNMPVLGLAKLGVVLLLLNSPPITTGILLIFSSIVLSLAAFKNKSSSIVQWLFLCGLCAGGLFLAWGVSQYIHPGWAGSERSYLYLELSLMTILLIPALSGALTKSFLVGNLEWNVLLSGFLAVVCFKHLELTSHAMADTSILAALTPKLVGLALIFAPLLSRTSREAAPANICQSLLGVVLLANGLGEAPAIAAIMAVMSIPAIVSYCLIDSMGLWTTNRSSVLRGGFFLLIFGLPGSPFFFLWSTLFEFALHKQTQGFFVALLFAFGGHACVSTQWWRNQSLVFSEHVHIRAIRNDWPLFASVFLVFLSTWLGLFTSVGHG